jgi:hypothetical protein
MSSYEIKPKQTVVEVIKSTRGRFPGERAPSGTIGIVWSSWVSNSTWGTSKLSVLSKPGSIYFTTKKCVKILGPITDFPEMSVVIKQHADEYFLPVFVQVKDMNVQIQLNKKSLRVTYLGKPGINFIPLSSIHPDDVSFIVKNPDEEVYSTRVEPWVLESHGIF